MKASSPILPGPSSASLEMISGKEKGKSYELVSERLSVGRSENNDIVLPSESVSRYHAVFERTEDGRYIVRDNQSKNGVVLNGTPVSESDLQEGDVVQIGTFVFRFNAAL